MLTLLFSQATLLYFAADLTWVARVPICVKSPGVIIKVSIKLICLRLDTWLCSCRRFAHPDPCDLPMIHSLILIQTNNPL